VYYVLVVTNCLIVYCIYYLSCAAVLTVNKDDYCFLGMYIYWYISSASVVRLSLASAPQGRCWVGSRESGSPSLDTSHLWELCNGYYWWRRNQGRAGVRPPSLTNKSDRRIPKSVHSKQFHNYSDFNLCLASIIGISTDSEHHHNWNMQNVMSYGNW